jgi:phosphotransferase system HPr (HPr) family protein
MTSSDLVQKHVTVNLEQGLHMIPCSLIAKLAREVECEIRILKEDQSSDARNVLELMMLKAERGTPLLLEGRGNGASEALDRLAKMFDENFQIPSE